MDNTNVEIERKYVIAMPDIRELTRMDGYSVSEIIQTYLSSVPGVTHRVRSRTTDGHTVYTETSKIRIDKMSSVENEREIDYETYESLLSLQKIDTVSLRKVRHVFRHLGQTFEIDVYPEWQRTCILETELTGREEKVEFPEFIRVIKEVTGERRYSNAGMSHSFPPELE